MAEPMPLLKPEDVERFLKRERDQHGKTSYWWKSLDDALDAFRLHMVTGTPLAEPRPQEGTEAFGVGREPLTEAEELRREVERLTEERDQAIAHDRQPYPTQWAYDQACEALEKHRRRADKAEGEAADLEQVVAELTAKNMGLLAEVQRLRTERANAVATVAELHQRLTRREQEHNADRVARDRWQGRANAAEAELANAKAVISKALGEVEHEEVVYLLNQYLSARPSTTGEGQ